MTVHSCSSVRSALLSPARSSAACPRSSVTTNNTSLADAAPLAIRIESLSKRYRLYQKPVYRLLDLFGMCPATTRYYSEHAALKDVDLSIARGEKVAIIGRNGAG